MGAHTVLGDDARSWLHGALVEAELLAVAGHGDARQRAIGRAELVRELAVVLDVDLDPDAAAEVGAAAWARAVAVGDGLGLCS